MYLVQVAVSESAHVATRFAHSLVLANVLAEHVVLALVMKKKNMDFY